MAFDNIPQSSIRGRSALLPRSVRILILLMGLLGRSVLAQSGDEVLVLRALERFRVAMVHPDSVTLASLASDQLVYVHSSGTVRDKQGFIDEFVKRWTNFTSATFLNQTVTITGNNAIVRHRLIAEADNPGYPASVDIIILMVWRKEGGEWKMLARQAAKIPE